MAEPEQIHFLPVTDPSLRNAVSQNCDWVMSVSERKRYLLLLWGTSVLFCCGLTIADPDLWGHTLYGMRSIEQGVLTEKNDPFSYTVPDATWVNHEWLTEYQMGWLWTHLGNTGLWWWRNFWVILVFATAAWMFRRAQASVAAAAVLLLFNAETLSQFVVFIRPQLATYGMFALTLAILRSEWDQKSWRIWLLPFIMMFWVNLHGGFLAGVAMQGLFLAAACIKSFRLKSLEYEGLPPIRMLTVFAISSVATLLNPYGLTMHQMLWYHLGTEQFVREWQPLWAAQQSAVYYAPYLLLALAGLGYSRWKWIDLVVTAVVCYEAISHIRHTALLAITIMILFPAPMTDGLRRCFGILHRQWAGERRRAVRVAAVACGVLILIGVQVSGSIRMWQCGMRPWDIAVETSGDVPGVPLKAIHLIQELGIKGNLVTDYGWAQFVIWHLYPETKIAFDGRYRTVYPAQLEREFIEFQIAHVLMPEKTPILDDYQTEIALISTVRGPCAYLDQREDWVSLYQDQQVSLYLRKLPKFTAIIDRALQSEHHAVATPPVWDRFPGAAQIRHLSPDFAVVSAR
ncbi:MAG: hypothetical protein O2955_21405 [Planctomycetota bacterium]|nr:hypothetical protein [Planctomycetota bacterium]MDA1215066.1 hypothetical protein [Planctomycetota bacterium]